MEGLKEKITDILLDFGQMFHRDLELEVEHGIVTESDSVNAVIYLNIDEFIYTDDSERLHLMLLEEKGIKLDIMLPLYMFLHELGHILYAKTEPKIDKYLNEYVKKVNKLSKMYDKVEQMRRYKKLKLEMEADRIALELYEGFTEKLLKINKEILDLLR